MYATSGRCVRGAGSEWRMDAAAARYVDAIDPQHRPLFDRLHGLILRRHPGVAVGLSYGMPTYRVDGRSLVVGVWKHGLFLYGMEVVAAAEVIQRHGLRTSKGTIQIRAGDAASMSDDEIAALVHVALGGPAAT